MLQMQIWLIEETIFFSARIKNLSSIRSLYMCNIEKFSKHNKQQQHKHHDSRYVFLLKPIFVARLVILLFDSKVISNGPREYSATHLTYISSRVYSSEKRLGSRWSRPAPGSFVGHRLTSKMVSFFYTRKIQKYLCNHKLLDLFFNTIIFSRCLINNICFSVGPQDVHHQAQAG